MAGVTETGFEPKTLQEVKTELEAEWRSRFGASVNLSPNTRNAALIGIIADRMAELWEVAEEVYSSFDPDSASGQTLTNLAALTGTIRKQASKSSVVLTATGTAGTALSAGRVASVTGTGVRFATVAPATIAAASAWAGSTAYSVGQRVKNGSSIYQATTAGTSAGSGGPSGTGSSIADNSVVWMYLGAGVGVIDVEAEAEETGPKTAYSGTVTTIETPVSGWSSVINVLDADVGADIETDAALRARREAELRSAGLGSVDSIRAHVLKVAGVTAVSVFENVNDTIDGDGVPAHGIEVLVEGGDEDDIRTAIFEAKPAGIQTSGLESGVVTDAQGFTHTVKFSRPEELEVWVIVNVTVDQNLFPADGEAQIEQLILDWGDAQLAGKDIVSSALVGQAFKVPGVLDAEALIGLSDPPTSGVTIAAALRQRAVYDSSRTVVNSSPGTP